MITSEARLAANRANSLKSSGPRTPEGKEHSRANSYKHGLTGAGVVMPVDVAEEVGRRVAEYQAQFRPSTPAGRCLVGRAATLAVRLERCVDHESEAISKNVRHARGDFDEARMAEVERLMSSIAETPVANLRRLRRTPEGVDRMISAWLDLKSDLGFGERVRWSAGHEELAENLGGRTSRSFGTSRVRVLSRAIRGDFDLLEDEEGPATSFEARRLWARARMAEWIDGEIAGLRAHRETLDLDAIEADRASAPRMAQFDASKEATLARRYESAAERGMYRALAEMRQVEPPSEERRGPSPSPLDETSLRRLASFLPTPAAEPARAASPPVPPASKPSAPASRAPEAASGPDFRPRAGSSYVPITIGRAR